MAGGWVTRWRVRAGYPLAIVYIFLATPSAMLIAAGGAIAVIGLVIRAAAAGNLRKLETLTTSGTYSWTRNPLYFGSSFLVAGFAVAGGSVWSALVIIAYFLIFYPAVMRKEEAELRARYGAAFDAYAARVPLFFPRPPNRIERTSLDANGGSFSWRQYRRNREYQAGLGTVGALALVWLRMYVRQRFGR
ncbi:MAG TPA: isoprenylcysteine carboxylmethyltransferase family protein [Candidatus Acidoferrales bacterium]|nr:isoprenylcysteine carboxylmethyltransferase family protein [Candidatus Acidoferrales bacterium]